jgi:hypothetical protein
LSSEKFTFGQKKRSSKRPFPSKLQSCEEYNRQQTPKAYDETAKKDAVRACIGIDPRAVIECVSEKAETAYQTDHNEQNLNIQRIGHFQSPFLDCIVTCPSDD